MICMKRKVNFRKCFSWEKLCILFQARNEASPFTRDRQSLAVIDCSPKDRRWTDGAQAFHRPPSGWQRDAFAIRPAYLFQCVFPDELVIQNLPTNNLIWLFFTISITFYVRIIIMFSIQQANNYLILSKIIRCRKWISTKVYISFIVDPLQLVWASNIVNLWHWHLNSILSKSMYYYPMYATQ